MFSMLTPQIGSVVLAFEKSVDLVCDFDLQLDWHMLCWMTSFIQEA